MPVFKYKAALPNGKIRKGVVDAANTAQAARRLREEGLYPIDISKSKTNSAPVPGQRGGLSLSYFRRISREGVAGIIRQLATLLQADLPLDKALETIVRGDSKQAELQRVFSGVLESIREGGDLAGAFANYPHVFNTTFVTMVRAGESSGTLHLVMERLADHIDQQLALRRKVQAALAYPVLMLIVGCCVIVFLLSFVVPKVTEIFFDMKRALPLPTQILISLSNFFRSSWPAILLMLVAGFYTAYRYVKTQRGKARFDSLILKMPVLGSITSLLTVGRFAKTLGMLLKNGVSLVKALEIVKSVAGNEVMGAVVETVLLDVQEGKPLAEHLGKSKLFEYASVQMIAAGEQSGRLDQMLLIVAADCENRVNAKLQMLTSLMEPLMILLLGGMVGFVVMAIMLPIFEMSNLVGG